MKTKYRFRHPKGRTIQVMFAHTPGKWKSTGTNIISEAVLWAESQLKEQHTTKDNMTLKEFACGFFSPDDPRGWRSRQYARNRIYKEQYYRANQSRLDRFILPKFGDMLISSINYLMIDDWLLSLTSKNELSDNSKNKALICFRLVMEEAVRQRLIQENPAERVPLITERHRRRVPFSPEELAIMFPLNKLELNRIWGDELWVCYFLIMRDTGFRPGEVAALAVHNVSWDYGGIYSVASVDGSTRKIQQSIKTTGRGKSYKVGILTSQTVRALKDFISLKKLLSDDYLFVMKNGNFIIPETSNKHLKSSLKRAGIDIMERTQYSLRHSFETAVAGKIENKALLELMAHTSYRPEYDHRTPEMILEQLQPVRTVLENRVK